MVYDLAAPPPPVAVPEGIEIAPFRHGMDERALYDAMRTGFGEDWPRDTQMDTWLATHQGLDDYDPELWLLARDGDAVVGALQARSRWGAQDDHGWVKNLAVMPGARHRGVGRALLFEAFRRFHERGKTWVVLGVDADNPTKAPDFYLRIGMQVRGHSWDLERSLPR
jgi:ribosomal protein S18 acetylase RimI-like enzyme